MNWQNYFDHLKFQLEFLKQLKENQISEKNFKVRSTCRNLTGEVLTKEQTEKFEKVLKIMTREENIEKIKNKIQEKLKKVDEDYVKPSILPRYDDEYEISCEPVDWSTFGIKSNTSYVCIKPTWATENPKLINQSAGIEPIFKTSYKREMIPLKKELYCPECNTRHRQRYLG